MGRGGNRNPIGSGDMQGEAAPQWPSLRKPVKDPKKGRPSGRPSWLGDRRLDPNRMETGNLVVARPFAASLIGLHKPLARRLPYDRQPPHEAPGRHLHDDVASEFVPVIGKFTPYLLVTCRRRIMAILDSRWSGNCSGKPHIHPLRLGCRLHRTELTSAQLNNAKSVPSTNGMGW